MCVISSCNPSQSLNTQASPAPPPPNRQWLHFLAGRLVKSWNWTISSSVPLPSVIQGGRWNSAFFKGVINVGWFAKSTDVPGLHNQNHVCLKADSVSLFHWFLLLSSRGVISFGSRCGSPLCHSASVVCPVVSLHISYAPAYAPPPPQPGSISFLSTLTPQTC